jgi:LacI family transcriptional regulator
MSGVDRHDQTPPPRSTIRDVSRVADVSIKTVSRVINQEKYVSELTRKRVERVMAELSFQPNSAARALAGHRSHQIVIICDNPNPWYVYEVQFGTRVRCQQDRVRMIAQPYDRDSPTLLQDIVNLVDQVHPDGLVLTPPACDDVRVLKELGRRRVPFVRIQPGTLVDMTSSVSIDNEQAAFDMTEHLLALGHRRIAFITGDPAYAASEHRLNGFARALAQAGIALDLDLVQQGAFDFASGAAAAAILLALPQPPTAIFASNDDMAAGALATAHRLDIAVPAALSIAGFDDTGFACIVWPPLTTIRQPIRALASAAVDLLLTPPNARESRRIPYKLIVRDSTGRVAI